MALKGPPLDITCTMISSTTMSSVLTSTIDELPPDNTKSPHEEPSLTNEPNLLPPTLLPSKLSLSKTSARYTEAQRDRTLRHHKLLQPTSSQERMHLSKLRAERYIEQRCSSSNSLSTLPEEFDESIEEENIIVYTTQASSSGKDLDCIEETCQNNTIKGLSAMSHATLSTASISDSQRSISDNDDISETELELEECPTPHLSPIPNELTKHYTYCQPCEIESYSSSNRFVVCADTQFDITRCILI